MAATHDMYVGELRPQHSRDDSRDSGIFHTTKGLWNAPGLNNCFLNSAVQVSDFLNSLVPICQSQILCLVGARRLLNQFLLNNIW